MNRQRVWIAMQLAAGLVLAGLGHQYASALRADYPYDSYIYYALAVIFFARVWRAIRRDPDPAWAAMRDTFHAAWGVMLDALRLIGSTLRELLPLMSWRMLAVIVIGLNVIAALLAYLIPTATWLWAVLWLASIVLAIAYAVPRTRWWSQLRTEPESSSVSTAPTWIEPTETLGQPLNTIGLVVSIGLLIAGQLLVGVVSRSDVAPAASIGASLDQALHLDLLDPSAMLGGWLVLIAGTLAFGFVTRRCALRNYPRLKIDQGAASDRRVAGVWLIAAMVAIGMWLAAIRSIVDGATGWIGVLPWLLAFGVMAACWWKIDRMRGVRHVIQIDRTDAIALIIGSIVILGVFAFRLGDVPGSIWGDEGAFFSTARDVARNAFTPDVFGPGTYAYPMAASIYQSIWIKLFGENVTAWRLGSVVAAWLAMVPLYFLVRSTLGRRVAWTSIGLYAVSPYLLTYARMGYTLIESLAPFTLALALLWLAVRRDSRWYAFLAGGAAGLSFFTHPSARFVITLMVVWLLWMLLTRSVRGRSIFYHGAALTLGMLVVAAPVVVYYVMRYPDEFASQQVESSFNNVFYARDVFASEPGFTEQTLYESFGPIQMGKEQLFFEPGRYIQLLARGLIRTALSFHAPTIIHENYLVGALAEPSGIFYLLGIGWCLVRLRRPGYAIYPAWLLIGGFVLSAMSSYPPRAALMLPIAPALIVLSALGLVVGIDLLSNAIGGVPDRAKTFGVTGLMIVMGFFGLRSYFGDVPARFPPDLDNAIFWQAQRMPRGSDVTLIQPAGLPDDYQPWGMHEFNLGVNFHLIKPVAVPTTDWAGLCPNGCAFFFVANDYYGVMPSLTQVFGNKAAIAYADVNDANQFYAFVP